MNTDKHGYGRRAALWSAVICHRFRRFGDMSPKQARVERAVERAGRSLELDGDESPVESADKSAHSKASRPITVAS